MFFSSLCYKIRLVKFPLKSVLRMSIFVEKMNPLTGAYDWVVQNENYDYHQEVARSAFADMLHDTERNQLYEKALAAAIKKIKKQGKKAKVLDIGTGTGLLSMMAVRNGADSVIACEAFKPMSECALKVIELNGFKDKITVIPKRSTKLTVGIDGDLKEKCNILVTEVFDTELIGEGALSTFEHAHQHLLETDCVVVPDNATVYAQVVECPLAQSWNKLKDFYNDDMEVLIKIPEIVKTCPGSSAVHDIQLSQLSTTSFNNIIPPAPVFRFDWSGKTPFIFKRSTISTFKAKCDGVAQVVFMWWELQMDTKGKYNLSCAPYWAHPKSKKKLTTDIPWRDHWMQAVYFLPESVKVKKGQEVHLVSAHDEYSLWFILRTDLKIRDNDDSGCICNCSLHVVFSRPRLGQINDMKKYKKYLRIMEDSINKNSVVLFLSEGFFYGLAAYKLGAKKLYFLETNFLSRCILKSMIEYNNIENAVIIEKVGDLIRNNLEDITVVFGEPYYISSILPWDNLRFLHLINSIRASLNEGVNIHPVKCIIKCVAVRFDHLYKIRAPLDVCEGFSMRHFDDLIFKSSSISDDPVEAQPLWEYPCIAVSKESQLLEIDFTKETKVVESTSILTIENGLSSNGIAFWVEWYLTDSLKNIISTGPTEPIIIGKKIDWDKSTKQGVYLPPNGIKKQSVTCNISFNIKEGYLKFAFS